MNVRQQRFDLEAARLEPWRQLERLAQRFSRLVNKEARGIRRNLKKNPTRLSKVNRMEILAVEHGSNAQASARQLVARLALSFVVRRAKGDVVNGARAGDSGP